METHYSQASSVVARKVAGELLLIPIGKNLGDLSVMYAANETAAQVWDLLVAKKTIPEITKTLLEEFEVEPSKLEKDIRDFIEQLVSIGALQ